MSFTVTMQVGVTGFCMGGALSFKAAVHCAEISAAAPFYGVPAHNREELVRLRAPVQAHFGELDDIVGVSSPADYQPVSEMLAAANAPYHLFTYPAGHGFTNPNNPTYSAESTALAFARLYDFMNKQLGP